MVLLVNDISKCISNSLIESVVPLYSMLPYAVVPVSLHVNPPGGIPGDTGIMKATRKYNEEKIVSILILSQLFRHNNQIIK